MDVKYDLVDPGISVCSPEVLALFSDNFDKADMDALVCRTYSMAVVYCGVQIGEVLESDLVDSTMYLCELEGVAARASCPALLLTLDRLARERWFHPLGPPPAQYSLERAGTGVGLAYRGVGTKLGAGAALLSSSLLGPGARLGAWSRGLQQEACNAI